VENHCQFTEHAHSQQLAVVGQISRRNRQETQLASLTA